MILNKLWLIGLIFTVLGWLFFVKATEIGEISVIEPLMTAGEIILILLAVIFLNERLIKKEWCGIILTIIGATMLSLGGQTLRTQNISWSQLTLFLTFSLTALIILSALVYKKIKLEITLALIVGISFGIGAILTELMTGYLTNRNLPLLSHHFFYNPIFPFMMSANLLSLITLQFAFQKGRASVIVPVQLSIVGVMSVVGGAMIFSESIPVMRIFGIGFIIFGTVLLSNQHSQ